MRFVKDPLSVDVETAAVKVATNESFWVRGKSHICWEAIRLQTAAKRQRCKVAAMFKIDRGSIQTREATDGWPVLAWDAVLALQRIVRRAMQLRRLPGDLKLSGVAIDAACLLPGRRDKEAPEAPSVVIPLPAPTGVASARSVLREDAEAASPGSAEGGLAAVDDDWAAMAHPAQVPPEGAWRTWMLMGGRGAGKTRAGAEWVRSLVESGLAKRVALVGPSLHEVREVMVAGPSGLCAIGPEAWRPRYESTRRRLVWTKGPGAGAIATAFSAEDPDGLRGSQFDAAWCDEIGAWAKDLETWKTLAFAMRLGPAPRIVATTTPRPRALVKLLVGRAEAARGGVKMTRAGTRANAQNLSPEFVAALEEDFAGTALARQELDGDLVEDLVGALWSRSVIEQYRASPLEAEGLERVVVAVDPPAGASGRSDACGIVVAGVKAGVVYVLGDATVRGLRPAEWGARVAGVAQAWGAGVVVAESNQGGEMVRDVLREACSDRMRVELRHASKAKRDRAAPVSAMYEQGKVRHVRVLTELEDEMCAFGAAPVRGERAKSPDRVDALVWAVDELMRKPRDRPRVERL